MNTNTNTLRTRAQNRIRDVQTKFVDDPLYALPIAFQSPHSALMYLNDLLKEQRSDGFLPHFAFPEGEIAAPPVFGFLAEVVCDIAPETQLLQSLLREMYPKILAYHTWLYENRYAEEDGILYSVHPAESYFDDSPQWDTVDGKNARVQCPLFNAFAVRSAESMMKIGGRLKCDVTPFREQHDLGTHCVNEKLWDDYQGVYHSFDLNANRLIPGDTAANVLLLFACIPVQEQAENLLENLKSEYFLGTAAEPLYTYATYDTTHPNADFSRKNRGAVNPFFSWLFCRGLWRFEMWRAADRVREDLYDAANKNGFRDYYDARKNVDMATPENECPLTAAFVLDLMRIEEKMVGNDREGGLAAL